MKSLLCFVAVVASFFLLLVGGIFAGGLMLLPVGDMPALFGATAGAVVGVCAWFKLVGYFVELEDLHLKADNSLAAPENVRPADAGLSVSDRDVRRANHMMGSGVVTFFSSLFGSPDTALLVGAVGVLFVAAGFIISLTGVEFPSEEGILRRAKLLVSRNRP